MRVGKATGDRPMYTWTSLQKCPLISTISSVSCWLHAEKKMAFMLFRLRTLHICVSHLCESMRGKKKSQIYAHQMVCDLSCLFCVVSRTDPQTPRSKQSQNGQKLAPGSSRTRGPLTASARVASCRRGSYAGRSGAASWGCGGGRTPWRRRRRAGRTWR